MSRQQILYDIFQLALTTLESLAEMLNERKREAEQYAAFKDKMRNISGKFPPPKPHAFLGKKKSVIFIKFSLRS